MVGFDMIQQILTAFDGNDKSGQNQTRLDRFDKIQQELTKFDRHFQSRPGTQNRIDRKGR